MWKNVWQAVFAAKLYEVLSPRDARIGNVLRLIVMQAALQPLGLVLMLPFPWLIAFFRNVALFAALGVAEPVATARRQAMLWTRQNWGVLALMSLGALLLFLNLLITIAFLPQLVRTFLGIEGDLARLGAGILNRTTVAVAIALTWLVIDPLLDAVYVLRCFYGESIATGADLSAALRRAAATILLAVMIFGIVPRPAVAQEAPAHPTIDPARLDRSMDEVVHRREFTWRTARPAGEEPRGRWVGWVRSAFDMADSLWEWAKKKIRDLFEQKQGTEGGGRDSPVTRRILELLIGATVTLVTGAAVFFFMRRRSPVVAAEAVTIASPALNLADESLTADQLSEISWLNLAEEWLAKGDCRLALRALYLAGLNYLGDQGMVSIRRWKSGLDYRRELERRTRARPEISPVFSRNVALFERGWYGSHGVDRQMVEAFAEGLNEVRNLSRVGPI